MGRWEVVLTLPRLHKVNDLRFSGEVGLVAGYYAALDSLLDPDPNVRESAKEAVILRVDGLRSQWRKVCSRRGEFIQLSSSADGLLYALGRTLAGPDERNDFLMASSDGGESWSELPSPPAGTMGIEFGSHVAAWAWSETSIHRSPDVGQSWIATASGGRFKVVHPRPVVQCDGALWVASGTRVIGVNPDGSTQVARLPDGFDVEQMAAGPNDRLWVLGTMAEGDEKRRLELRHRTDEGTFALTSRLPRVVVDALHVGRTSIAVVGSDTTQVPPAASVYWSDAAGQSWVKEDPAISNAMGPVYFETDEIIWAYGSADRIERRRPWP